MGDSLARGHSFSCRAAVWEFPLQRGAVGALVPLNTGLPPGTSGALLMSPPAASWIPALDMFLLHSGERSKQTRNANLLSRVYRVHAKKDSHASSPGGQLILGPNLSKSGRRYQRASFSASGKSFPAAKGSKRKPATVNGRRV